MKTPILTGPAPRLCHYSSPPFEGKAVVRKLEMDVLSVQLGLAFLLATFAAHAQTYSIGWHTIDGGGGTSTGGVYSVSGTIGQPDAGCAMTGGNFSLTGGFWALAAVQTP